MSPRLSPPNPSLGQRALRLHRGESLVPELDRKARGVGHTLREGARLACGRPFGAAHADRQTHDESRDVFALGPKAELSDECDRIAGVERTSRVGQQAQLVVDRQTDPSASRVEPTRSAGTARRASHGQGD
jgi:hypothetical protein